MLLDDELSETKLWESMEKWILGGVTEVCVMREVSGVMRMVTSMISDGDTLNSDLCQFLTSSYFQFLLIATE